MLPFNIHPVVRDSASAGAEMGTNTHLRWGGCECRSLRQGSSKPVCLGYSIQELYFWSLFHKNNCWKHG